MKTSITKIAIVAVAIMYAAAASAEYLYAFIGDEDGYGVKDYTGASTVVFDYATFSTSGGSGNLKVNDSYNAVASDSTRTRTETAFWVGDDDTSFEDSFTVKLWLMGEADPVAWQTYQYSQYVGNLFSGSSNSGSGQPFYITSVIPEPTSAMLLLFGFAGLALRRRKI